jgi:hypothetical protein
MKGRTQPSRNQNDLHSYQRVVFIGDRVGYDFDNEKPQWLGTARPKQIQTIRDHDHYQNVTCHRLQIRGFFRGTDRSNSFFESSSLLFGASTVNGASWPLEVESFSSRISCFDEVFLPAITVATSPGSGARFRFLVNCNPRGMPHKEVDRNWDGSSGTGKGVGAFILEPR